MFLYFLISPFSVRKQKKNKSNSVTSVIIHPNADLLLSLSSAYRISDDRHKGFQICTNFFSTCSPVTLMALLQMQFMIIVKKRRKKDK